MADNFKGMTKGLESPADRHFSITPSDSIDLAIVPRALFCLTAGTVAVADSLGFVLMYPVSAGMILPLRARKVMATGTTANVCGWE